jgi:TetR/AcrR family transcriptional regulator, repressor for neighboring sulfatase
MTITRTLAHVASGSRARAPTKRVRRSPEEAKAIILDGADRVFAKHLPDVVGLKDVAREAGVSHALITHYFGTYDALVEAALERRFHRLRDEVAPVLMTVALGDGDAKEILRAQRRAIKRASTDPATVRLVVWATLSGRVGADDFFPHRMQGLKVIADALGMRSTAPREDLEFLLVASFALTTTWLFGRRAFLGALGRKPTRELEEAFEHRIELMLEGFLRSAERRRPS